MSDENKKIVRRFAEEVIQRGNLDLIPDFFADAFAAHDPVNPDRGGGLDGVRHFVGALRAGLSDMRYTIEDLIAEGDRVVYRWSLRGTHAGPFMGVPATGNAIDVTGIDIFRIERGKIAESWVVADTLTLLRQVGILPAPGAPVAPAPPSGPTSGTPVSAIPPTKRS